MFKTSFEKNITPEEIELIKETIKEGLLQVVVSGK